MISQATPRESSARVFADLHDQHPQFVCTAPGRVNLIGEHTDYNDGFVLPLAINHYTAVACGSRPDRVIDVVALDENNERVQFSLDETPEFDHSATWSNYVRGVVGELQRRDYRLCGANLVISGNIPMGAGLSSSAALEMAVIAALTRLSEEPIDAATAALTGQAAENNFVGCQCGIMDQLISACGQARHAMLIDCRTLQVQPVSLPAGTSILIIDSKVQRKLVDGEYNDRRRQCEAAAEYFAVDALRDLNLDRLQAEGSALNISTFRRARHVVTENQRTLDMVDALTNNRMQQISALMAQSHASMRDDFEITVPQTDKLVELVGSEVGEQGGVRMTGGGFGGCIVALLPDELVEPVLRKVQHDYHAFAGHHAEAFVCQAADGAFS